MAGRSGGAACAEGEEGAVTETQRERLFDAADSTGGDLPMCILSIKRRGINAIFIVNKNQERYVQVDCTHIMTPKNGL